MFRKDNKLSTTKKDRLNLNLNIKMDLDVENLIIYINMDKLKKNQIKEIKKNSMKMVHYNKLYYLIKKKMNIMVLYSIMMNKYHKIKKNLHY